MYRLYYWFRGADPRRPGGAWWYKDFKLKRQLKEYLVDIDSFLYRSVIISKNLPEHTPWNIRPPAGLPLTEHPLQRFDKEHAKKRSR